MATSHTSAVARRMSSRSSRTRFWKRSSKTGRVIQSRASAGAGVVASGSGLVSSGLGAAVGVPHDPRKVCIVLTTARRTAGMVCLKNGKRVGARAERGRERAGSDRIAITLGSETSVPTAIVYQYRNKMYK